jgi:benzoate-CoA ligase
VKLQSSNRGFRNASEELLLRSARAGCGRKIAVLDERGSYSFDALRELVNRAANALRTLGLEPHDRAVLCLADSVDFVTSFLGTIAAGIVPVPVNTLCSAGDYAHALADSGAKAAVVSETRLPAFLEGVRIAGWNGQLVRSGGRDSRRFTALQSLLEESSSTFEPHSAPADGECFWLYSSGSTGQPKAAVHLQRSLATSARLYAQGVLGMGQRDVIYSAAKMSFAYGLGNSLSFPLYVCATAVLSGEKPTAEVVNRILRERRPTIFFGVPTLFAALLQSRELPRHGEHNLRFCVSAGEALPAELGRAWKERTGVDILDGIGSTEMLHIFISNSPGAVAYGTSGRPTPGYRLKLLDEEGRAARAGEIGDLWVSGPTCCAGYWNQVEKSRSTFVDGWMRTGDKYRETPEGNYEHCGRSDDMLKVGGFWVSPLEVESALRRHGAVLEAAVVGYEDEQGLVKPKAFVVLKAGYEGSASLEEQLKAFVKNRLAPYKYPRRIQFVSALPRTATGKLQRFQLRRL